MSYVPQTWVDGAEGGTPLSAARLNHIEAGIASAATAPDWSTVTGKPATFPPTIGTTATTALAGDTPIPAEATWATLAGKPAVIAAGTDAAAARAAIGAGTGNSNLALGTTATTALRGDTAIPTLPTLATAAELQAGTVTATRLVSPKLLADEIDRRVAAAIAAIPAG